MKLFDVKIDDVRKITSVEENGKILFKTPYNILSFKKEGVDGDLVVKLSKFRTKEGKLIIDECDMSDLIGIEMDYIEFLLN